MQANQPNSAVISRAKTLIITAIIFSGFLAGSTIDRFVVQFPAFRQLDIINWAQYSRHADLGNGIFLYPILAGGGFLLPLAASIIAIANRVILKSVAMPLYTTTILAGLGLFFTIFAAPVMLSVRTMKDEPALLQQAFDKFVFWSTFRAIVQVFSFFALIWAMANFSKLEVNKPLE